MGGSGRSYISQEDINKRISEARQRLAEQQDDAAVNSLLREALIDINDRDVELVSERLDQIEEAFEDEVAFDRILFGGSVAKHTYVDGMSDIDSLVILRDDSLSPNEAKSELHDALLSQIGSNGVEGVTVGDLAVTVKYSDGSMIQLLPAVQVGGGLSISSPTGRDWSGIEPQRFSSRLTNVNQQQNGTVVPTIKLAKSILKTELGDKSLTGYHVEALAVRAFQGYNGRQSPKQMLLHFFSQASHDVVTSIQDVTGQSFSVDTYLGRSNSPARSSLSDDLARLSEDLSGRSLSQWRAMFQ